ncbi:hypothetical protein LUZ60_006062 [Juncus effusus]|nr:hypothetical protein LUZ60_006062 [Juncus effusus]
MDSPSNSFDLKLTELLKSLKLTSSESKSLQSSISAIVDAVNSVPNHELDSEEASGFMSDLGVEQDEKVRLGFRKPASVHVAGGYEIGAAVKPDVCADVFVEMNKKCFHLKDYLNHRYHAKRCLYLCAINKYLQSQNLIKIKKIQWTAFNGEARKPVLVVFPETKLLEGSFSIRIIPTIKGLFNVSKLSLERNNIRSFTQDGKIQATPNYNNSILEDLFLEENFEFVKKALHESHNLLEGLILLKVWARQRSSIHTHDCINGHLLSVFVAFLTTQKIINNSMTAGQIFRVVMKFIGVSNAWQKGIFLQPAEQRNISKEDLNQYLKTFSVFLFDVSGNFNLTFRITKEAFSELRDEAARTLNCINHTEKCKNDGFDEIFMTKVDFSAKFDSLFRINLKGNPKFLELGFCKDEEPWRVLEREIQILLSKGLTDRSKLVRAFWSCVPSDWNIRDGFAKFQEKPMQVGILLSTPEKSHRKVDIGPQNKALSKQFREFWGAKSEFKHFLRENITAESTAWECENWETHGIIKRIGAYLLNYHFGVGSESVECAADEMDFCLKINGVDPIANTRSLTDAFDKLSEKLKNLNNKNNENKIPLKISTVQPLHSAFRHSCVLPPFPNPLANKKINLGEKIKDPLKIATCVESMDVLIKLEGSNNWPLDPILIEKTKHSFLLQIGKSLKDLYCTASEEEVNIHVLGYSFSLKMLHEKTLDSLSKPGINGKVKNNNTQNTQCIDQELFIKSQHSGMINGLHGRFPIFGPVVRLAKRWISAHLFSDYFSEETIELLVAYLFLKPFPFHAPLSRISGFLRFLRLLANYDWAFAPLIVDINNDFTSQDETEIYEDFMSRRKNFEEKSANENESFMYIATTYDKKSEAWTKPNKPVVKRLAAYSKSSAELLSGLIINGAPGPFNWECIFKTPLNNYDAVVILHSDKLARPHHLLFPSDPPNGNKLITWGKPSKEFHSYQTLRGGTESSESLRERLLVNFDPTNYFLRDLKREFPDKIKVWYDSIGGDAIGLTWNKNISKKREREEETEEKVNFTGVLKEIGEIGKGFVKSVHLLKAPKLSH